MTYTITFAIGDRATAIKAAAGGFDIIIAGEAVETVPSRMKADRAVKYHNRMMAKMEADTTSPWLNPDQVREHAEAGTLRSVSVDLGV